MKHMKTVVIPMQTREVVDVIVCDFCAESLPKRKTYDITEVKISRTTGSSYPEGGWRETTGFDCCDKCWGDRVLPTLKAIAVAAPTTEEVDY